MAKGIYCYIDDENDKIVYVGKDSNIDKNKRHREHFSPSRYDEQPVNRILQNNLSRYLYKVLWEVDDCSDNHLNQMEIFYIKKHDPKFNFTDGGDGISGYKHTEESKRKISEALKGENNPNYGKTLSKETRKKISETLKGENNPNYGKTLSKETRKKISEALKGENNPMLGKKHSKETRKKISEAQNTTGFYRVYKQKNNRCKQGFIWRYQYFLDSKRKSIKSVDLKKLEKKVRKEGLEWKIIDDEKAKQSLLLDDV